MKKLTLTALLFAFLLTVQGQTDSSPNFTVTGTRFLLPLFDRFNDALRTDGQPAPFQVTSRNPNASLTATATPQVPPEPKTGYKQEVLAKIVYLPVVNSRHPELKTLLSKGITIEEMKQVFFEKKQRTADFTPRFNVLSRNACAAVSFSHFMKEDIKFLVNDYSKIENDSLLIDLIKTDTLSISFLDPSNIYDPNTGKVTEGITVIPIDSNLDGRIDDNERFYDTKGELIEHIKTGAIGLPSGLLVVSFPESIDDRFHDYVQWIKTNGDAIIEDYGFLSTP